MMNIASKCQLIEWNGYKLIRVSIQGYNTRQDTDRLMSALKKALW